MMMACVPLQFVQYYVRAALLLFTFFFFSVRPTARCLDKNEQIPGEQTERHSAFPRHVSSISDKAVNFVDLTTDCSRLDFDTFYILNMILRRTVHGWISINFTV